MLYCDCLELIYVATTSSDFLITSVLNCFADPVLKFHSLCRTQLQVHIFIVYTKEKTKQKILVKLCFKKSSLVINLYIYC